MNFSELIKSKIDGNVNPVEFPNLYESLSYSKFGYLGSAEGRANPEPTKERVQQLFEEVRNWIAFAVDSKRVNAVYFDTTTLYTVDMVLKGQNNFLLPETLLDLSTFVNAVVLYDNVIHLENPSIDSRKFNEALGNQAVFISLPVNRFRSYGEKDWGNSEVNSLGDVLPGLWNETMSWMSYMRNATPATPAYEDLEAIREAWEIALGRRFSPTDLFKKDIVLADPLYSPSHTASLLRQLMDVTGVPYVPELKDGFDKGIRDFVSECNQRSLFNLGVSYFLKLHYMPGCPRMPFQRFLYRRAKSVQSSLRWIKQVDEEYKHLYEMYFAPDESNLLLPFLLAAVLSKIKSKSLSAFFEALAEVRHEAETFRNHRAELDEALLDKDAAAVGKIRKALEQDADQLRIRLPWAPVCGGIAAVFSVIAGGPPGFILAAIGLLTGASQSSDYVHKLRERTMFPEYWFLVDLNQTAKGMMDALPTVIKLWGLNPRHAERFPSKFERLKALQYG